ncbi:MAG TPA: hypothetical protein VGL56_00960 [Fimbriimonadaceae bacterium]|jgi:prepilin-type processing-associated H-X9-DG protein
MVQRTKKKPKLNWRQVVGLIGLCAIFAAILWPVTTGQRIASPKSARLSNAKQVALGVIMYANDYDGFLPDMQKVVAFQSELVPYMKNETLFQDPISKRSFVPNAVLSGINESNVVKPDAAVLLYSPLNGVDGTRAVAFADGHAKTMEENEFVRLMALSGTELNPARKASSN